MVTGSFVSSGFFLFLTYPPFVEGSFYQCYPERTAVSVPPSWPCPEGRIRLDGTTNNADMEETTDETVTVIPAFVHISVHFKIRA